jgi:hypothetical protein
LDGCIHFFFANRRAIHYRFKNFFEYDEQDEQTEDTGVEDTPQIPPKEAAARFYFGLTLSIANEDITKLQQIENMSVYLVLNSASVLKDRRIKEQEEIKKLKNQKIR